MKPEERTTQSNTAGLDAQAEPQANGAEVELGAGKIKVELVGARTKLGGRM